ncbi:MAG TPA: hypothetical protein VK880_08470 [Anaerolineales bacterium]|nr:hypothetical protein [Anaerolineales bacterium]
MATAQNRLQPPLLPFLTALIFTGVVVAVGLSLSADILENFLLCGVVLILAGSWRWVASGQDAVQRAALFLSLSVALVVGRIWWEILPGNWLVLFLLGGGFGVLAYLFLRLFLGSAVEVIWALTLPVPPRLSQLETWRTLLYTDVPLTASLIWRVLIEKLQRGGSAEAAKLLADAVTNHPNQSARLQALHALDHLTDTNAIDALCTVWADTRHPDLAELLTSKQWRASAPPETLTLSALLLGEVDFLRGSKAERIQPLAQAALDADPLIAERAGQVLRSLKNVEAQEALCRLVIEQENPPAQAAALSSGYLPRDEQPRVLFLFMTEQWERYASHDFDRRLMHLAYLTAPEPLRQRIREKLRSVGRIDFLPIIAGESSEERAAQFNASESEVLIQTLIANRDWAALWPRVFDLPFQSSARAILALSTSGWKPADAEEQAIFAELAALAAEGLPMEPSEVWEDFPLASMQATARVPGRINAVAFAPSHPAIAVGTGQG